MADAVEAALRACPWLAVERVGDNVVARTELGRDARVLLAGHLDTVPPVGGNEEPRIEDDVLFGVGAVGHEGWAGRHPPSGRVSCRAGRRRHLVLLRLRGGRAGVQRAAPRSGNSAPTCWRPMSPSSASPPVGSCRGRMPGHTPGQTRRSRGARAHTARPGTGRNAIHRLAPVLAAVGRLPEPRARARRVRVRRAAPGRGDRRRRGRQRRPRRGLGAGQPPLRPRPDPSRRPSRRSANCSASRSSRVTGGSWSSSRRRAPGAGPSRARRAWWRRPAPLPGQAGLDRRGFLLGPRDTGRQLRPG